MSSTPSTPEEGELTSDTQAEAISTNVNASLQTSTRLVNEKDSRYFMLAETVCRHCGTKGHLSFNCSEQVKKETCFVCGKQGHISRNCPNDLCYFCRQPGHRARDCPNKGKVKRVERKFRSVSPPRQFRLDCYVCGNFGHLDCSIGRIKGVLSCYNCGQKGHSGVQCTILPVEKVMPIVMELLQREKTPRKKKRKRDEDKGEDGEIESNLQDKAHEFHRVVMESVAKTRYNRN